MHLYQPLPPRGVIMGEGGCLIMCVKEGGGEHWSVLHAPFFCMIHLKRPSDFIGQLLPYFSPPCLAISLWVLQINSTNILIIK